MRSLSLTRRSGLLALVTLGALGCGLISSDITKVTFNLPTKHYTFTSQMFPIPAGVPNQKVTCGPGGMLPTCPAPAACDSGVCSAEIPVNVHQQMNLKMEVPALMSVSSQSLADITLESLSYAVNNTSNLPLPAIELYLAPDGVTDPMDPSAQKFGTVPAIAANSMASGDVTKEPGADDLFIMYGHNFGTPFNFIAATTVIVPSGTTPTGMIDIKIDGTVAAKL
jgi:hypothetical protein